jgi:hypothetical protein
MLMAPHSPRLASSRISISANGAQPFLIRSYLSYPNPLDRGNTMAALATVVWTAVKAVTAPDLVGPARQRLSLVLGEEGSDACNAG